MKQYAILKNNRRSVKVMFDNYETARQYLRKLIRKMGREAYITELNKRGGVNGDLPFNHLRWDELNRNPTNFTALGYAIRNVA
jgi:hypothetical protein